MPLLSVRQGDLLERQELRSDLAVLYSTGAFEGVSADVEPWFVVAEDGTTEPAVLVTYRVLPAPELRRIEVHGNRRLSRREVLVATGLRRGDRVPADAEHRVALRVLSAAAASGLDSSHVQVSVVDLDDARVDVHVDLVEGAPLLLEEIAFTDAPLSEARLRLTARRAGLSEGEPLRTQDVRSARDAVEALLIEEGFLEARVSAVLPEGELRGRQVTFVVHAGPRLVLEHDGSTSSRDLRRWLALEGEGRIDASLAPVLAERVRSGLQDRGYFDAVVEVEVEPGPRTLRIAVRTRRGARYRLGEVRFDDATVFDADWLQAAATEASPAVLGRGRVSPAAAEAAAQAITSSYRAEGYRDARVEVESLESSGARVHLTFRVVEGDRTDVSACRVRGAAPEVREASEALAAEVVGQPWSPRTAQELVRDVTSVHREAGYAGVDARARTEAGEEGASLVIEVDAGERLVLRNVIVRGNRLVGTGAVLREIPLEPGEVVTPDGLDEARHNLYGLDSFRSVELDLQGEGAHVRDLLVSLDEKPAWSFELGAGVATDEGARTYGSVSRRNLFGVSHQLSLLGQVGLGYASTGWRLDPSPEWRAGVRYAAPNTPTSGQLSWVELLANQREQEPTYRLARTGLGTGTQLEMGELLLNAGYAVQLRRLEDVDPGALLDGDPWLDGKQTRRHGALTFEALLDRRDDPFDATRGVVASVEVDLVEPFTSGGPWMVRGLARGEVLVPAGPVRFGFGADVGAAHVPGRGTTLPVEERLRLGGAATLRGHPTDSIGPKMRVEDLDLGLPGGIGPLADQAGRERSERWVPTGGEALVRGSAELIVPATSLGIRRFESTAVVAFADVGNVYFLDPGVFATSEVVDPEPLLRAGVGLGLRQTTPLGPLRLDVGVNPAWFRTEWAAERGEVPARLHLSLGAL